MTNHEIKKPTLFISHATSDAEFANAVQQEIEKVFANGINVFCTSSAVEDYARRGARPPPWSAGRPTSRTGPRTRQCG